MKMIHVLTAACALALALCGTVLAQCGKGGDCGNCNQGAQISQLNQMQPGGVVAGETDLYRQFRQNTLDLRQAMMNKRFDLQRENLKGTPDVTRLAGIKADITAIQARINQIRTQSNLPDDGKRDGECFKIDTECGKQIGMGGCNGLPCGQK